MFTRKDKSDIARIFMQSTRFRDFHNGDTLFLFVMNSWLPRDMQCDSIHRRLNKRWELQARIAECAMEDGQMWVVESGMDCDGVMYSGHLHCCTATLQGYQELLDDINSWADGTFSCYPITEEEMRYVRPRQRDLAMEAYEDGHPHTLSAARYDEFGSY